MTYILDSIDKITFNGSEYFDKLTFSADQDVKTTGLIFCTYQGIDYSVNIKSRFRLRLPWEVICKEYTMEII